MEQVTASLHKNCRTTLERISKYISDTYFTDVNLYGKLYLKRKELTSIKHWDLPHDSHNSWEKWDVQDILQQKFSSAKVGDSFGPTWSTHWFKIEFTVPESWKGQEVHLRWNSQSEAMIRNADGKVLRGVSPETTHKFGSNFCLSSLWDGSKDIQNYYIEMACTTLQGCGRHGLINPPETERKFTLEMAEICVLDNDVYQIVIDLETLHDMALHLGEDPRGYEALYTANEIVNRAVKCDMRSAKSIGSSFFQRANGERAHTLALIGNCHIDSAWLWPYSETKRKCARSWASAVYLMKDYPEMVFACSQAQQFSWVKDHYPDLFSEMKTMVASGRFIPVGCTWVEMDGLIPSGESFIRQFLYGQKFYQDEFGVSCKEFWLPDTFGYSAQIPQICQHFGIQRFLTQKLSWSLVNKFPHHNFIWEGLDGSTVLAHFPPGNSYEMKMKVEEALHSVSNLQDKGRVSCSAFLYGYGDGGGGPTRDMLERARRMRDVDGCPRMVHMTPDSFFTQLESEQRNLCRWVGELYLELHNGTYTSQANIKRLNFICEVKLRQAELFLSMVSTENLIEAAEVERLHNCLTSAWKLVLLNQFHDVLPGSSIGIVYQDAEELYNDALTSIRDVVNACKSALTVEPTELPEENWVSFNTLPWRIQQISHISEMLEPSSRFKRMKVDHSCQPSHCGGFYIATEVPGLSYVEPTIINPPPVVLTRLADGNCLLENKFLTAEISPFGQITKLYAKSVPSIDLFAKHDGTRGYGNQLKLYSDIPLYWDAWDIMDYHLETGETINSHKSGFNVKQVQVVEEGPLVVRLRFELNISKNSTLLQDVILAALSPYLEFETTVFWKESHKLLKVCFDTAVRTSTASFGTQFGYLQRPTHTNTSWDMARYEVCGHRWTDLSESSHGISVLTAGKYGWCVRHCVISLSLLRSPKSPDDECDMGKHTIKYAVMPHAGTPCYGGVLRASYEFCEPVTLHISKGSIIPKNGWLGILSENVMIDTVKLAEGSQHDIIVRLYEMYGGSCETWMQVPEEIGIKKVEECNGMEEPLREITVLKEPPQDADGCSGYVYIPLQFSPFKLRTIRLYKAV